MYLEWVCVEYGDGGGSLPCVKGGGLRSKTEGLSVKALRREECWTGGETPPLQLLLRLNHITNNITLNPIYSRNKEIKKKIYKRKNKEIKNNLPKDLLNP